MSNQDSSFSGRLKRYANVSSALSGAAAGFVGQKLFGLKVDHDQQAQNLAQAFGDLKGPLMKVAQMLATIPDAVPEQYTQQFLQLQSDAPSMGRPFVQRRMKDELGLNWQEKFASFNMQADFAASLGQVHQAFSHEGIKLACKLQYPDMMSVIQADLYQLKIAFKIYEKAAQALKTENIFEEIQERLYEELDYQQEAYHISLYEKIFAKSAKVHLPKVYYDLSTKRLLTMSWLEGNKLETILSYDQSFKNNLARTVFHVWYKPLYQYGIIHADPHLGNYTFKSDGTINLLDFGCIRIFSPEFINGVVELYRALQDQDQARLVFAYEKWGFVNLSKQMIEVLNLWAGLLYEPLLEDKIRPLQKDFKGTEGRETALKIHSELSRLGGIKPPREFVFLDRATVGIGSVMLHLKAELNWHQEFEQIIADFDQEILRKNQSSIL